MLLIALSLCCALAVPSSQAAAQSSGPLPRGTTIAPASAAGFELLGSLGLGGPVAAVAAEGSYAYVGVGNRLAVLNVADPAHPAQVGQIQFPDVRGDPSDVYAVAVAGRYAYAGVAHGLRVVDVGNPAAPAEIGRYIITDDQPMPFGGWIHSVVVAGSYVYAITQRSIASVLVPYTSELLVLDVANPRAPTPVGAYFQPGLATNAVLAGRYAYFVGKNDYYGQSLLKVVDIAHPAAPALVGSTPMGGDVVGLAGNNVYVTLSGQTRVFDVSNPAAPSQVGGLIFGPYEGLTATMAIANGYAYVAGGTTVRALDLTNPVAPVPEGQYSLPEQASDVLAANRVIYVTAGQSLFLLRHNGLSIAGRVTHANGVTPVSGVTIAAGAELTATTTISGTYAFYGLADGTYTLTPTLDAYTFWPVTQTVTLAAGRVMQDFVLLPRPVATALAPNAATALVYTDTQGLRTDLQIPAGAVTQTTTLRLTPTLAGLASSYTFAGHAFTLAAERGGVALPEFSFAQPLTVTIGYSTDDVRVVTDTAKLALWRWTGSGWRDATQSCTPTSSYQRDVANRKLAVAICRAGRYALFGPTWQVLLPQVGR
jgi:hypothetical protein